MREKKDPTWLYSDIPNIKPRLRHENCMDVIPLQERERENVW